MARPKSPCGTPASYRRHLREGEDACIPCRDAHNAAHRAEAEKRRNSAGGSPPATAPPVVALPGVPVSSATRVSDLRRLREVLSTAITTVKDPKDLATLSRELRQVLQELEKVEVVDTEPIQGVVVDEFEAARQRRAARASGA
mgnify:CR=1 FL=1